MSIKELGEFGFIEMLKSRFGTTHSSGIEGIGDDCAVIPISDSESFLISTDMLVEDVHFIRTRITASELGSKSLAVNLSDIAAMGGAPTGSFLSISLPASVETNWLEGFTDGYKRMSDMFGVPLLGGDTTSSSDKIAINVTVIGRAQNSHIKRRNAAQVGDKIFVTGILGGSAQGLKELLATATPSPDQSAAIEIHHNPEPHIRQGIWLGSQPQVHAMMDISDGLASDLRHILNASRVSARINTEGIPAYSDLETALTGGEDYVLLLTVCTTHAEALRQQYNTLFGNTLYKIGEITASDPEHPNRIQWIGNNEILDNNWNGFSHF